MGTSGTMIDMPKGDRLLMAASSQRETVSEEAATGSAPQKVMTRSPSAAFTKSPSQMTQT